jgi:hypothetical protein
MATSYGVDGPVVDLSSSGSIEGIISSVLRHMEGRKPIEDMATILALILLVYGVFSGLLRRLMIVVHVWAEGKIRARQASSVSIGSVSLTRSKDLSAPFWAVWLKRFTSLWLVNGSLTEDQLDTINESVTQQSLEVD